MAISEDDIKYYKSLNGSSNGGARSAVLITATKADYWPNISDGDRIAGGFVVRKCFVANNHGSENLDVPSIWNELPPTNTTKLIGLGVDATEDDDPDQGNMVDLTTDDTIDLVSDGADTRNFVVYGLDALGDPQDASGTLNGTTPVTTGFTFSKVFAVVLDAVSGSREVTISETTSTVVFGVIGSGFRHSFLWIEASSKATGLRLPNLGPGLAYGLWEKITWAPNVSAVRPNTDRVATEEN
jgi:hypothetical protein